MRKRPHSKNDIIVVDIIDFRKACEKLEAILTVSPVSGEIVWKSTIRNKEIRIYNPIKFLLVQPTYVLFKCIIQKKNMTPRKINYRP